MAAIGPRVPNARIRGEDGRHQRPCDGCTLCCTVIAANQLGKNSNQPCLLCTDSGCKVYAEKPEECVQFECLWSDWMMLGAALQIMTAGGLTFELRDPEDRPDRTGVVFMFETPPPGHPHPFTAIAKVDSPERMVPGSRAWELCVELSVTLQRHAILCALQGRPVEGNCLPVFASYGFERGWCFVDGKLHHEIHGPDDPGWDESIVYPDELHAEVVAAWTPGTPWPDPIGSRPLSKGLRRKPTP